MLVWLNGLDEAIEQPGIEQVEQQVYQLGRSIPDAEQVKGGPEAQALEWP
jgi:hypothetical protein